MRMFALLFLSLGITTLVSDGAFAQQNRAVPRRTVTTPVVTPQQTGTTAVVPVAPPAIDKSSALGQALAACNQEAAGQEVFELPGLKGPDVKLDRCYRGRSHLICVFTALITEATSLTNAYTKIVDAKYPELTSVEGICKISPDTFVSDIAGSEDFAKRFKELKSQYDAATRCTANVQQSFKDISLADLTKAPEVLQSMTASLDDDVAKVSKVQSQISDLSEKMDQSNKAMKEIIKVHHALCIKQAPAQSSAQH